MKYLRKHIKMPPLEQIFQRGHFRFIIQTSSAYFLQAFHHGEHEEG